MSDLKCRLTNHERTAYYIAILEQNKQLKLEIKRLRTAVINAEAKIEKLLNE